MVVNGILGTKVTVNSSFTVALVEDEAALRQEMAFQLQHMGFVVEMFDSAPGLYRYLATHPRTIVVLDIGLPGEDGLSVCEYLRQHDAQLGIVFLTARSLRDERLQGMSAGADAYFIKPVDMEELALMLKRQASRLAANTPRPVTHAVDGHAATHGWLMDMTSGFLIAPNKVRTRLSLNEGQVIRALLAKAGEVCFDVELHMAMGTHAAVSDRRRLEVLISRLRSKVERECGLKLPLRTIRSQGYLLEK